MKGSFFIPLFALIVGGIAGAAGVWFWKPGEAIKDSPAMTPGTSAVGGDIVCTGRVDTLKPIIPLFPKLPGTVISVPADESLMSPRGQVLMEIDPKPYQIKADLARVNVEQAKSMLDEAEAEKLKFNYLVDQAVTGVKAAQIELELANKELKSARDRKADPKPMDAFAVTDEMIDGLESKSKLAVLKLEYANLQLESLRKTNVESKVAQARAARDAANLQKAEADAAVADCRLLAPTDGSVLRVNVSPGAQVAPGSPLVPMLFAPAGPMVVRAELDQEYICRVEAGAPATIRDELQPNAPTWEGTVLSVSRWIARPRSVLFDPLEINDVRTCEVVVEVKRGSATGSLSLGQRVRVRIKPLVLP